MKKKNKPEMSEYFYVVQSGIIQWKEHSCGRANFGFWFSILFAHGLEHTTDLSGWYIVLS